MCAAVKECKWSMMAGACLPQHQCHSEPADCGFIQCSCTELPTVAMPPWDVLDLNFSSALDERAVRRAFHVKARTLAPERNPACLARAGREFIAARRARDTLLMLATIKADSALYEPVSPVATLTAGSWRPSAPSADTHSSMAARLPLLAALKLGVYRLARDQKAKMSRGWLGRALHAVEVAVQMPGRIVRSAMRFCRANAALLLVATISAVVAMPAVMLV